MSDDTLTVLFTSGSEKNPYHNLLFRSLEENGVEPIREPKPLFLPLTRAVLRNDNIDAIHLGWLYGFYMVREFTPSSILNTIITVGRAFWFCIDLLLVRLLGTRLVWTVHNKYHHERYYPRVEKVLNVIVANTVHALTVKCGAAKDTISRLYRVRDDSKIAVIPDGNYIDAYPNEVGQDEAREQLDIGDEFVYLYFGLIRPYKGVEQLIEAFQSIEEEDVALWIVGDPKTDTIRERISSQAVEDDRIHTRLEYVPDEDIQYYMNAANVLVFPYQDILNSGSVYLGLSFGKPIIAPRIGCIPETVSSENDLLYDLASDDGLLNMLRYAKEPNLADIGSTNREKAETLAWDNSAEQYSQLYFS